MSRGTGRLSHGGRSGDVESEDLMRGDSQLAARICAMETDLQTANSHLAMEKERVSLSFKFKFSFHLFFA